MQSDIDYIKIGQRIRRCRMERHMTQAELGAMIGCSNNHVSHIETGQTRVSNAVLMRIARTMEMSLDYFLLDTPYAQPQTIINTEIAEKLGRCKPATLVAVNKILDSLLEQQDSLIAETIDHF